MFNFGFTELFALAILALLVIGPKQLPELARNIAKFLNEFKRITSQITDPVQNAHNKINDLDSQAKDFLQKTEENIEECVREPDPSVPISHHELQKGDEIQESEGSKITAKDTSKNES